jgi:glycosyltransferase involved in cell wall biosynthesis
MGNQENKQLSSSKKVLIILGYGELGGSEKQALYLAENLLIRGHKVRMLNLGSRGLCNELFDSIGVPNKNIVLSAPRNKMELLSKLARLYFTILPIRPQIIIPFTRDPNVYANTLKPYIPFARVVWNQRDEGIGLEKTRLEKLALKRADQIISNSTAGGDYLVANYGIKKEKITIIKNGVRSSEMKTEPSSFTVGMVANLHVNKDFETLLKAWKIFMNNPGATGAQLLIAGRDDGLLPALLESVQQLGIQNSVKFCGQVKDISSFLNKLSVGVHSSRAEGCSNAVLEMMSYGLTVIANQIKSNVEVLGSGYEFYFPRGDAEKLAGFMMHLQQNPGLAAATGRQNKERAEKMFSVKAMVDQYETILE